ncbi:hypothetical protein PENTCL1PPCAC_28727, partial [Pristionchus entomophagus]
DCIYGLCESLRIVSISFNKNSKDKNDSVSKSTEKNDIVNEMKQIGQFRVNAFNLSSSDKIGNVILKALDLMCLFMESDADSEKLDFACKSLEMERRLTSTWDRNR